jgi:hypothetical protein
VRRPTLASVLALAPDVPEPEDGPLRLVPPARARWERCRVLAAWRVEPDGARTVVLAWDGLVLFREPLRALIRFPTGEARWLGAHLLLPPVGTPPMEQN